MSNHFSPPDKITTDTANFTTMTFDPIAAIDTGTGATDRATASTS